MNRISITAQFLQPARSHESRKVCQGYQNVRSDQQADGP